jgi:hypothetical protein
LLAAALAAATLAAPGSVAHNFAVSVARDGPRPAAARWSIGRTGGSARGS